MYKLIACDVDGTLLDQGYNFTKVDMDAISKLKETGVGFTLCSGRAYKSLGAFAEKLGISTPENYIVGFNGALVYDPHNSRVVWKEDLDKDAALEIISFYKSAAPANIDIAIYLDGENCLSEAGSSHAPAYHKASLTNQLETTDILSAAKNLNFIAKVLFIGDNSALRDFEAKLTPIIKPPVGLLFTSKTLLEIVPSDCSKAKGLKWICRKMGIEMSEVIAIGDNYNDISMIKEAGLGVAVANAVGPAKDIANYVTENNCASGAVAEVIHKFILNSQGY